MAAKDDLPKGIHAQVPLPDKRFEELWNAIIVDEAIQDRLIAQAIVNFTVRPKVSRAEVPLHGVILLAGEPGTGKTSLAKGLANRVAQAFSANKFTFIEVDPHALSSNGLGKSQRGVTELFGQTIAEAAMAGPTIVLLDEVETLAGDRSRMSLEANPIDVHRATDAVLVQLDQLAEQHKNLLFIATSNFPQALDAAFTSRADLVIKIPLPDAVARLAIIKRCLVAFSDVYPEIGALARKPKLDEIARSADGLDARAIRKAVVGAIATSPAIALNPRLVTLEHVEASLAAAKAASFNRGEK